MELFDWNDIFSDCVPKLTCEPTCTFTHPALQTSDGQAAQALNQHKKTVLPQRRGWFICKPAIKKNGTYPGVLASHWQCPKASEKPCCSAAVQMTRWITDVQKLLHNCPGWDISAPPTQLSPSNFTAGISPIESQVACKGRQVLLSSGNTSSSRCLQNIVSKWRPHLSKMFTSLCSLIWLVLKGLYVCFVYWLFTIYYFPYLKPMFMSTAISAILCHISFLSLQ